MLSQIKTIKNYSFSQIIGKGSFALVFLGINTNNNQQVAIKEINLSVLDQFDPQTQKLIQFFKQEVQILKQVNHPNIIGLFDIINTDNHIYLIFDYCSQGDLEKYLKKNTLANRFSEKEAKPIIIQLIDAIKYLNSCKIVHRDIKLANVLINQNFEIKLADFGFAKLLDDNSQLLESYCGTPLTMAPEILKKYDFYDGKCDIWSLGVIFYQIIVGKPPFFPIKGTIENLIDLIEKSEVKFPDNVKVSDELQDLIRKMLQRDATKRIDFEEIWNHPWVQMNKEHVSQQQTTELLKSLIGLSVNTEICSKKEEEQANWIRCYVEHKFWGIGTIMLICNQILDKQKQNKSVVQLVEQYLFKLCCIKFKITLKSDKDEHTFYTAKDYQFQYFDYQRLTFQLCLDLFEQFIDTKNSELMSQLKRLWNECYVQKCYLSNDILIHKKDGFKNDQMEVLLKQKFSELKFREKQQNPVNFDDINMKFNISWKYDVEWKIFNKIVLNRTD